jgi:hypothetical protein
MPIVQLALIAGLLLCGHTAKRLYVCTYVCPVGLHMEGVLVICSRGTRMLGILGKGADLT